jgi:hypothetical protein
MSVAKISKTDRRQIAEDFKERKVPKGIFAIRCSVTGEAWVGSSPNLSAAQNSYWFQLRMGRYRNLLLQNAWKEHGEQAFTLEVLEQLDDDVSPLLLNELLVGGKKQWAQELSAHIL